MKIYFVSLSILFFNFYKSQEKYQVIYDYQTDIIQYYQLNKENKVVDTLSKAKFKKNLPIEIKIKNVNPFALNVSSVIKEEEIHQQNDNSFNFTSLLGGISNFSKNNKIPLNIENLPINEKTFSRGSSRGNARGSAESLNKLNAGIEAIRSTIISNLLNPNLNKEEILSNIRKVSLEIIDGKFSSDPDQNYYLFLADLKKIVNDDTQVVADYISLLSKDYTNELPNNLSSNEILSRGEQFSQFTQIASNLSQYSNNANKEIDEIKELYSKLESSNFEKVYDYTIQSDKANIDLKFMPSDFSSQYTNTSEKNIVKERQIKLYSKGGFKISTSVALTLNNFGDKSKEYYIGEGNIIGADKNSSYIPNLSTMINFYPVIGNNFNIGGSFGVSIPISDNIKGVNFLLGPSLFFGDKNRISLTGGVAYGPVQKLTNGLIEGQVTNYNSIDNYTKNVYDVGYFMGISFSLANIK